MSTTFESIRLSGFLSFKPDAQEIELRPLNVIIGPNGTGKSNLLEAFSLLRSMAIDVSAAVREGGGALEWLWKGPGDTSSAIIDTKFKFPEIRQSLRHLFAFTAVDQRMEVSDERLENKAPNFPEADDVFFYYRWQHGRPVTSARNLGPVNDETGFVEAVMRGLDEGGHPVGLTARKLVRIEIPANQSILSQRRDPDTYPEITSTAELFSRIQVFREWTFGRNAPARRPQAADLPTDFLLPDLSNLGLVLNELQHQPGKWTRFQEACARFLPRFKQLTTRIVSNTVQIYVHEENLSSPIPATRLSDGTLRFLGLLAILLGARDYPLICIEEPELGLHPDAIALLAELLIEASALTQVIVTTHSESLISALGERVDSILVCQHTPVTGTTLKVRARCPHAERFFTTLESLITN